MKFNEIKLKYTCPAACPENIYLSSIYKLDKDHKGLYFTDGNYIEHADEWYIKMLFSPCDENIVWADVEFTEIKTNKK